MCRDGACPVLHPLNFPITRPRSQNLVDRNIIVAESKLHQSLLQSKGVSPRDVLNALTDQNLVLPGGTAKIDEFEYDVRMNSSPRTVAELNDLPIKQVGNSTI